MDLKNFESTSILAISAIYKFFWSLIPEKYKLPEDDNRINDLEPFYDPTLSYENRLHYKLTNINFPNRDKPWFVITWNTQTGLINSSLNRRRYQSTVINNERFGPVRFKWINTDLQIDLGICSNSMAALYELQENIVLKIRDKKYVDTDPHSIIGSFPVNIHSIDGQQNKLDRNKGTLCYLTLQIKVDYPIIENVQIASRGVIKEIHSQVNSNWHENDIEKDIENHIESVSSESIVMGEGEHHL